MLAIRCCGVALKSWEYQGPYSSGIPHLSIACDGSDYLVDIGCVQHRNQGKISCSMTASAARKLPASTIFGIAWAHELLPRPLSNRVGKFFLRKIGTGIIVAGLHFHKTAK